jgi:hypothetical protein
MSQFRTIPEMYEYAVGLLERIATALENLVTYYVTGRR